MSNEKIKLIIQIYYKYYQIKKSNFPGLYSSYRDIKIKVDHFNYATKFDVKKQRVHQTLSFA